MMIIIIPIIVIIIIFTTALTPTFDIIIDLTISTINDVHSNESIRLGYFHHHSHLLMTHCFSITNTPSEMGTGTSNLKKRREKRL